MMTISQFSTKILTFFLVPLYTSILTTDEYGIYDLYNISSSEKEKILNDPFNYKNGNKNFIEKLKIILEQIKEETSKTLILLDKEYIKLNDYIVNNLLSKYLKNQKTTEEELINIFQNFEYEIDDDYSYLEKSKATKKLKKKLGKNQ